MIKTQKHGWNKAKVWMTITISLILLLASLADATLKNGAVDWTISGITGYYNGGCFSDGKRMIFGNGYNFGDGKYAKLFIFNNVPAGNFSVDSADVKIIGFNSKYFSALPQGCIAGDKLLVVNNDTPGGIKVWNSIPDTNTTAGTFNSRISINALREFGTDLRTDGTRICFSGAMPGSNGDVWLWNTTPDYNTDTSSAVAKNTDGWMYWATGTGSFGTSSGKFYVTHQAYLYTTDDTHYVSIYNSPPSSNFSMGANSSRITLYFSGSASHSVVEIRNILYVFYLHKSDTKVHVAVWKNIPAVSTDTSTADTDFVLGQTDSFWYSRATGDLHNFYVWNGIYNASINAFVNDYDTFTVAGSDFAPATIDKRHLNQVYEKIRIYTYPGKTTLNAVKLKLLGSCVDADVSSVKLYEDVNNDSSYTQGTDQLLGSGAFSNKTAVIEGLNLVVNAGEKNLLVTYDISENATLNNTVGVKVEHLVFDKYLHEVPQDMSSSLTTVVDAVIPVWNNQLRIVYTQNQSGSSDTLYSISLDWDDATGGAPPLTYKAYHLIDDSEAEQFSESVSEKIISNLDSGKRHRFKVKVIDAFGNETQESAVVFDDSPPAWSGVYKIRDASTLNQGIWTYKFEIYWEPAVDSTSKSANYEVWTKEENKDWEVKATTWDNSCKITGLSGVVYVRMKARDSAGNYTQYTAEKKIRLNPFLLYSEEKSVGVSGGEISMTDLDGDKVKLEIPEGALGKDYNVFIEKILESEYTYQFRIYDSKGIEKKVVFAKPVVLTFYYNDEKISRLGYKEDDLHIKHSDGVRWTSVASELNKTDNTVKTNITGFSKYRLSSEKDNAKNVWLSSKVVTPNDDEINDVLAFTANWNYEGEMSVQVFDANGKLVWAYRGNQKSVVWDCKTANQSPVESGVYVYTIKAENQNFNGTFVVMK